MQYTLIRNEIKIVQFVKFILNTFTLCSLYVFILLLRYTFFNKSIIKFVPIDRHVCVIISSKSYDCSFNIHWKFVNLHIIQQKNILKFAQFLRNVERELFIFENMFSMNSFPLHDFNHLIFLKKTQYNAYIYNTILNKFVKLSFVNVSENLFCLFAVHLQTKM